MVKTAEHIQRNLARKALQQALEGGYAMYVGYGQMDITGYVLSVKKHTAEIQCQDTGEIREIAFVAIDEMSEV